jgi:hypothetical protein
MAEHARDKEELGGALAAPTTPSFAFNSDYKVKRIFLAAKGKEACRSGCADAAVMS